jgi:hypothetical protein
MTYAWSRAMSAATTTYGIYALAEPRHLGRFLRSKERQQQDFDLLAQTYGARDLAIGTLGMLGRSERTVTAAMLARIAFDVSDGLLLSRQTEDEETRTQILGITFGWAALNAAALVRDRRKARLARRP